MPFSLTRARVCLIALFAPMLALAQPAEPDFAARTAALVERHRVNVDGLLGNARQEGMALLVIPTLNLDAESPRDFNDDATRDRFVRQRSTFMHWNHKTDEGYAISAGAGDHKLKPTDPGPQFQTVRGKLLYQVIPVWPGEYRLNRITLSSASYRIARNGAAAKRHGSSEEDRPCDAGLHGGPRVQDELAPSENRARG